MEASDNRRKVTVGIFILIGLVIFILGVFTLGSQKKTFIKSFPINAIFNDIEGLKEGGNVWFSGVKVGTIKKIRFYGTSQVQVLMNIESDVQQYIHKDARASIASDGLIGNKIIVLSAGSTKVPVIEPNDQLIATPTLTTDEMMKTFQVSNKNLVEITSDLKILTADLRAGKGPAGMLLNDETLVTNIQATVSNLRRASETSSKIASDFKQFSSTVNNKEGFANKMFTDTSIIPKLQASATKLKTLISSASVLTDNLNKASAKLNDTNNPAGLLLNDRESAERIKQILNNLQSSSYNLNQDLKALQNNFLLRGYFKKQAKIAADTNGLK